MEGGVLFLFSKTVKFSGNTSADIYLVMNAVGQEVLSLSMLILQYLWTHHEKFSTGGFADEILQLRTTSSVARTDTTSSASRATTTGGNVTLKLVSSYS